MFNMNSKAHELTIQKKKKVHDLNTLNIRPHFRK